MKPSTITCQHPFALVQVHCDNCGHSLTSHKSKGPCAWCPCLKYRPCPANPQKESA